jgi:hydrogenase maturation protein HypF
MASAKLPDAIARRWLIGGRVQGVGFRPFACILARQLGVTGSVRNLGGQVEVVARADADVTHLFLRRLLSEHPALAQPALLSSEACGRSERGSFEILPSSGAGGSVATPDQSVCDACLAEMADPRARRYRYPFIACTQCGPRFTIAADMPFDRASTAMAGFHLCPACQAEYDRPADRRFHAQVISCADCGPRLTFQDPDGETSGNEPALARTIAALRDGAIVAVKGIGGYHLLCDARNDQAVRRLRARKNRPGKPLAVMFPWTGADGLDVLRRHCEPDADEASALRDTERPIVLIPLTDGGTLSTYAGRALLRPSGALSASLAPGLRQLGAMLPYSPLHHLIAGTFGAPLVATSGNISGEPVLTEPADAHRLLAGAADGFLDHDRPILRPSDDGVGRVIAGRPRPLRLGRGSAPLELALDRPVAQPMLALGGQTKVTVALAFGTRVVISPHLGDMDSPRGLDLLEATVASLQRLYAVRARVLVCDRHPGYTSARWASGMKVTRVLHHHAHAAAVAGEFPGEVRWLCFTWDGVGLGADGTLWGGEALLGKPGAWTRVATFRPFAPPGGDKAAHEPWRSAAALAWDLGVDWSPPDIDVTLARAAWVRRLNCPATSSVGRLFDAASALLGLVQRARYEGEGPMMLEALLEGEGPTLEALSEGEGPTLEALSEGEGAVTRLPLMQQPDGVWQTDWAPMVPLLLDQSRAISERAVGFHASLALALVEQAVAVRRMHGAFAVGLAGGVFQNRHLCEAVLCGLRSAGFRSYLPASVPCNDAGLSFGQVVEAAAAPR